MAEEGAALQVGTSGNASGETSRGTGLPGWANAGSQLNRGEVR